MAGVFQYGLPPSEQSITIAQMLDMQSGMRWTEDSNEQHIQSQPNCRVRRQLT